MPLFPTFPPGLEQSSLTINSATWKLNTELFLYYFLLLNNQHKK